jgi:hypothetical protein
MSTSLVGCGEQTYSFKQITNNEISNIQKVYINNGPLISYIFPFDGDYTKILDTSYIVSKLNDSEASNIVNNYSYRLFIDVTDNNQIDYDLDFYIYNNKIYFFNDTSLYESTSSVNYDDFTNDNTEKVKCISGYLNYDYGSYIHDQATMLIDNNIIWFNFEDALKYPVAGDELLIYYTGEYVVNEVYPGIVDQSKLTIKSIDVIEADIAQFKVTKVNDELTLVPVDSKYSQYHLLQEGYVISADNSFKSYKEYEEGTILYGSLPKSTGSIRVDALYDYNPRDNG